MAFRFVPTHTLPVKIPDSSPLTAAEPHNYNYHQFVYKLYASTVGHQLEPRLGFPFHYSDRGPSPNRPP